MRVGQFWGGCLGVVLAAGILGKAQALPVMAEEGVYTVTFQSGQEGDFKNPEAIGERYVASGAASEYEILHKDAIKLKVTAGTTLPALLQATDIEPGSGYYAKNAAQWGPEAGMVVDGDRDYTVAYGELTDPVEYQVVFTDAASGDVIAPSATARANVGDVIVYTAPVSIISTEHGIYSIAGEAGMQMTLGRNGEDNVLTYTYSNIYDPARALVEEPVTQEGVVSTNVELSEGVAISAARVPAEGAEGDSVTIEDQEVPGAASPGRAASHLVTAGVVVGAGVAAAALVIWLRMRGRNAE